MIYTGFLKPCECIGGVFGGSARLYLDLNFLFLIWDDICMPWDICSICSSCQRSVTILVAIAKPSAAPAWSRSTQLSEGQRITAITSTTGRVTAHFHRLSKNRPQKSYSYSTRAIWRTDATYYSLHVDLWDSQNLLRTRHISSTNKKKERRFWIKIKSVLGPFRVIIVN